MKILNNKNEYVLILMANAVLFLYIAFAKQNCKENNRIYKSCFHRNNIEKTIKVEQLQEDESGKNGVSKEYPPNKQKRTNTFSNKRKQMKDNLYGNFSIYSFFNY